MLDTAKDDLTGEDILRLPVVKLMTLRAMGVGARKHWHVLRYADELV